MGYYKSFNSLLAFHSILASIDSPHYSEKICYDTSTAIHPYAITVIENCLPNIILVPFIRYLQAAVSFTLDY